MTLKDRLKEAGISYQDISNWLQKRYDTIVKAVNRESFSDLEIKEIAKQKGIMSSWLSSGKGSMLPEKDGTLSAKSSIYDHEEAIRMHKLLKEYIPESMMDVWEKQLSELTDLCEYKELYLKAKEYYVGKKK